MHQTSPVSSVLIVDDMPMNIHVLAEALKDEYQVHVAESGAKALADIGNGNFPDIILLDVMMPGMDGYEVCRRLKEDPATMNIPVVFVTAMDSSEDETRGFNLGAVDYITKPFSIPVVRARVRTHLQLKQRTDMLEKLSMIDALTGVANRRSFDQALEREWRRAARDGFLIAMAMVDIDYFKAYNDHHGHGAGDECLRRTAQALQSVIHRPLDVFARYGGEEFAALLPETDCRAAAQISETMRATVEALAMPHGFSSVSPYITVSVGFSCCPARPDKDCRNLVNAADQALYQAKEQGRNRVKGD